jgi:hypothetical protein
MIGSGSGSERGGGLVGLLRYITTGRTNSHKRAKAMSAVARELGLEFSPEVTAFGLDQLAGFPLSWPDEKSASNLMHGDMHGVAVAVFDYHWRWEKSNGVDETVAYFRAPHLRLPQFRLTPDDGGGNYDVPAGMQRVEFPGYPPFSGMFQLGVADGEEAVIRRLFDDTLIRSLQDRKGQWIEGGPEGLLVLYRRTEKAPTEEVRQFLAAAVRIYHDFANAVDRATDRR